MDIFTIIILVSFIIFVGYLGDYAFIKFKFPDVLILIIIGYLITFLLRLDLNTILYSYLPIATTISLIIILFEGGISLHISLIRDVLKKAVIYALFYYFITFILISLILYFILNINYSVSILYGAILSSPSVAIVIPLINRSFIDEKRRHMYIVEVTLLDLFSIVITISLIEYFPLSINTILPVTISLITNVFAQTFFGFLSGIFWIELLRKIEKVELSYMLTLGFLFAIYALSDLLWKNGMISSVVFGIVLGNNIIFRKWLKLKDYTIDENIFKFNKEVVFFMRTVIFVAVGSIFIISFNFKMVLIVISILIIIYLMQILVHYIFEKSIPDKYVNYIMPRGLTQIVLGIFAITTIKSLTIDFIQVISFVVIITNLISAIIIYIKK
ncbi:MAG: cation:proton antiporter [Thermoplasmata archaeon]